MTDDAAMTGMIPKHHRPPARTWRPTPCSGAVALAVAALAAPAPAETDFLLIDRGLDARLIRVVEIKEDAVVFREADGALDRLELTACVALTRAADVDHGVNVHPSAGLLVLVDGQRLPGYPTPGTRPDEDAIDWTHPWLGQISVPIDLVSAVTFSSAVPVPQAWGADLVLLANGDRLEGLITGLGDPISIEVEWEDKTTEVHISLERALGVALVSQPRPPAGRRLWFIDGTVVDARRLAAASDDGYLRLTTAWSGGEVAAVQARLADMAAILFEPAALVPLASVAPSSVESSVPRFHVPPPRVIDPDAPLGSGRIEYRGPIVARYAQPAGCRRFAAEARLPAEARLWADFELVIRDDGREAHRERVNAANPVVRVNVPLAGSELTIELTQGANGPIQDRLIVRRAMFLVE